MRGHLLVDDGEEAVVDTVDVEDGGVGEGGCQRQVFEGGRRR